MAQPDARPVDAPAADATPTVQSLPAICDQVVARVAACGALSRKPRIFLEAKRQVWADQLAGGTDRAEIEKACATEAAYWNDRFANEKLNC